MARVTLKAGRTVQIDKSIQGKADDPLPYLGITDVKADVFFYVFGYLRMAIGCVLIPRPFVAGTNAANADLLSETIPITSTKTRTPARIAGSIYESSPAYSPKLGI